jgi:hypothetical protein
VRLGIPANATIGNWLREQTHRPRGRLWTRRKVPPESLRCHPDLCDRLEEFAHGLSGTRFRYVGGFPVLVHPGGVVFAVGAGTTWIAFRLPPHVHTAVVRTEWGLRGLEGEWIDIDPWLSDMPRHDGLRRLRGWSRAAFDFAGELAPVRQDSRH